MPRLVVYAAAFLIAGLVPAMAQTTSGSGSASGTMTMTTMTPVQFVVQAKNGNQFEIASSTLALDRTQNDQVKEFAQRIIDDHKLSDDQLREVLNQNSSLKKQVEQQMGQMEHAQGRVSRSATGQGVAAQAIKGQDGMLSPTQQQVMQRLRSAGEGAAFDRDYLTAQREAHRMTIDMLSTYIQNGTDNALKNFATETLPVVQEHMRMLEQIKL
jgi:putative membrane protein